MYTISMGRKEFVSWLGNRGSISSKAKAFKGDALNVRSGEILLVWEKKPSNVGGPYPVVVVPDTDLLDFFAFVSTYVSSYKPFSAFFNVTSLSLARRCFIKAVGLPREMLSKLVAVVIAEAHVQIGGKINGVSDIPVSACFGTFSDAVLQLVSHDAQIDNVSVLAERWLETRNLLGGDELALSVEELVDFWKLALDGLTSEGNEYLLLQPASDRAASEFLRKALHDNFSYDNEWSLLTEHLPASRLALRAMEGSKESRVRFFDEAIAELLKTEQLSWNVRSLIAGFLASKVGGGSLQYLSLAYNLSARFKTAPLWFALFSSCTPGSDYLSIGNCLGRLLERELDSERASLGIAYSDISLDELRVIPIDEGGIPRVRKVRQSTIDIEVFPRVTATFRVGRRKSADGNESSLANRNNEIRHLLERITKLLDTPADYEGGIDLSKGKVKTNKRTLI